jgi:hypothetical protein
MVQRPPSQRFAWRSVVPHTAKSWKSLHWHPQRRRHSIRLYYLASDTEARMSRRRGLKGERLVGCQQKDSRHFRLPPAKERSWSPRTMHKDLKHTQGYCPTDRVGPLSNPDQEYCNKSRGNTKPSDQRSAALLYKPRLTKSNLHTLGRDPARHWSRFHHCLGRRERQDTTR